MINKIFSTKVIWSVIVLFAIISLGIANAIIIDNIIPPKASPVKNITTQDLFSGHKNGKNFTISEIANSKSMSPTFDYGHKLILQYPILSHQELKVGDIIIYETRINYSIVHRIVKIGEDKKGWYCVTKGDNDILKDPKVRFYQIKYLVVGVLY